MTLYRPMVSGDVAAGLALCRAAGWNQTAEDWHLFLKLSPRGCCVAVDDEGQVRGTVTTMRYEGHFSWIGMVLVDPAHQRQGIGVQLLRESLHILQEEDTVKLDATPLGREIYTQLDFLDEYRLTRMEIKTSPDAVLAKSAVRRMELSDLAGVLWLDAEVFGARREGVLRSVFTRGPQFAWLSEDQGRINGYCMARFGYSFTQIGPVIARDVETATKLTTAALRNAAGRPVVIDALQHTPAWMQWLSSLGFREQRPLIRMYRGSNAYPGNPENQFAILGPEFG